MHSAFSPWLVLILAPSTKSRLASWTLQSLDLLGSGSPGTGLWFLPLARHIVASVARGLRIAGVEASGLWSRDHFSEFWYAKLDDFDGLIAVVPLVSTAAVLSVPITFAKCCYRLEGFIGPRFT